LKAEGLEADCSALMLQSLTRKYVHAESDGNGDVWNVLDDGKFIVKAATLKHTVTSFGYG
jgi:hypothetical protein